MNTTPTDRETVAARRLAEAVLEFVLAVDEGRQDRSRARRPVEERPGAAAAPPTTEPALLNVREAAQYLGVSTGTVHNMTAPRGPLPCVKIATRLCYVRRDLKAFIRERTVRPVQQCTKEYNMFACDILWSSRTTLRVKDDPPC